jgi:hypothetical protein
MWIGWERNAWREGDKDAKLIKERKKRSKELRYE